MGSHRSRPRNALSSVAFRLNNFGQDDTPTQTRSDEIGNKLSEIAVQQYTIAIVDDDPSFRKALARQLSAIGHVPVLFASAGDFLSAAATSEATCLLVDIHLGDSSGLDLARQLSGAGFKYPLIFMTCSDDDTVRQLCMDFGCVAFLRKPFHDGQLLEALYRVQRRR